MRKLEYFLKALENDAHRYKAWVLHCFSRTKLKEDEELIYRLYPGDKHYYFNDPESGETVVLEDSDVSKPPFHFREEIKLSAGSVKNLKEDATSNYGRLLANVVALVYPFGDKVDYINGEFNIGALEKEIAKRLTTDPEYQNKDSFKPDNPIYVSEYLTFVDAILSMEGYSQLCVPSATERTMTRDPRIPELKKQLLEKYKDQLHDPAVVAKIDAELIAMDKEWIKGDLGEGFFHKSKSYDIVRKKAHLMHGYEAGFGLEPATIENSLSEGWDIDKLPAMVNSLREGSYGRGKMTAEGGYATKVANRMFQNVNLKTEDCGTKLGWVRRVEKSHVGYYYIANNGSTVLISDDNIQSLEGKEVKMRTPQFCKAKGVDFCRYCLGDPNSENKNALSAHVAALTSHLMDIAMQSAHGKALKTTKYKPEMTIF
tara:strand:+ start:4026 stop:5309 length:1284 start_codon:yes stop_codon:yes gene_type:complete